MVRLLSTLVLGAIAAGVVVVNAPALVAGAAGRFSPDVVFSVRTDQSVVALTIDDGPSPATREILDVLRDHGARATFFLIGDHLLEDPAAAAAIVEQGSEIGHHMMSDRPSIALSPAEFRTRFDRMHDLLSGVRAARLFRPGSGWYDEAMIGAASARGYTTILGSVYPFDAWIPSVRTSSWYVVKNVGPGAIIVLHDGAERGIRTAETLRRILPRLAAAGYRVTTVSELLESSPGEGARTVDAAGPAGGPGT